MEEFSKEFLEKEKGRERVESSGNKTNIRTFLI
jgi:hypothetical protein